MAKECVPFKEPGSAVTVKAAKALTGKRFIKVTAKRSGGGAGGLSEDSANVYVVERAKLGEVVAGVARQDAAENALVGAYMRGSGFILPIEAGAEVKAGELVMSDAEGRAIPLTELEVKEGEAKVDVPTGAAAGLALDTAGEAGKDCEVLLW